MRATRRVIVNADDFGLSDGVNAGIIEAANRGVVRSASLMVRGAAASAAAEWARGREWFSLGLHLDLAEWHYHAGRWTTTYEVVPLDDADAVHAEIDRQVATFRAIVGDNPTHIDSHQHLHREEPARAAALRWSNALEVPLRHFSEARYVGSFYGQTTEGEPYPEGITVQNLLTLLEQLEPGTTELGCHPGVGDGLANVYASERSDEVQALCDPRVSEALLRLDIELCSFRTRVPT
ncbi:MAG: ChbG/HpnK family deacetylase [bacterium]